MDQLSPDQLSPGAPSLPGLTPRQIDVLRLICQDEGNQQIADVLGISHRTVQVYVSQVLRELNLETREQAFRFCLKLVDEETIARGRVSQYGFLNGIKHPIDCPCEAVFCHVMRRMAKNHHQS